MSKLGYVYVAANAALPNYVKVGHTNDIARRMTELDEATDGPYNLPGEWLTVHKQVSVDCIALEFAAHAELAIEHGRWYELFECTAAHAAQVITELLENSGACQTDEYKAIKQVKAEIVARKADKVLQASTQQAKIDALEMQVMEKRAGNKPGKGASTQERYEYQVAKQAVARRLTPTEAQKARMDKVFNA